MLIQNLEHWRGLSGVTLLSRSQEPDVDQITSPRVDESREALEETQATGEWTGQGDLLRSRPQINQRKTAISFFILLFLSLYCWCLRYLSQQKEDFPPGSQQEMVFVPKQWNVTV